MHEFLEGALGADVIVELRLEAPDHGVVMGWVVALGPEWVVLNHINDGLWLDGYAAVAIAGVSEYRDREEADEGFVRRVAEHRGYGPEIPAGLDARDTESLIASLARPFPLIALDFADDESTYSEIGELLSVTPAEATLRQIGTEARWSEPATVPLAGLTGLTVDDGYLRALALDAHD